MSEAGPGRRVAQVFLEAADPPAIDWTAADMWRVVVLAGGVPCHAGWVPSPGRLDDPDAFTDRLVAPHRVHLERAALEARLRDRMGLADPSFPHLTRTVAICTRDRPHEIAGALEAVSALDPPAEQVVVVDNAPSGEGCRAVVEATGATYVCEPRPGLDRARQAAVRAATGDLVAFTDDDCRPPRDWLDAVDRHFADPAVAVVTGPGFTSALETDAEYAFERSGGFTRDLRTTRFDWRTLPPSRAGAVGAGANMVWRRSALVELDDVFPAELDAGTPTQSGGDTYAFYRALAAGRVIVHDPGMFVIHRHRTEDAQLAAVIRGYGIGLSAAMAKVLVEHRELEALAGWSWLPEQYVEALSRGLSGEDWPGRAVVPRAYLAGGLVGPGRWWRSRRGVSTPRPPDRGGGRTLPPPSAAFPRPDAPRATVVVTTRDRPAALARCLAGLARQSDAPAFEIVVVDDAGDRPLTVPAGVRVLAGARRGAAAARNLGAREGRGAVVVFIDDDLVPEEGFVAEHLRHHDGQRERIVIGACPPHPQTGSLMELAASFWWHEHMAGMRDAARLVFTQVLSGNMSAPRDAFLALEGFDENPEILRREDWAFGLRALNAGVEIVHEPAASARHEFSLSVRGRLEATRHEARGDVWLAARHPEAWFLAAQIAHVRRDRWALVLAAVPGEAVIFRWAPAVLGVLERLAFRARWLRTFDRVAGAAYLRGTRDAGGARARAPRAEPRTIDLGADGPLAPPRAGAPPLQLRHEGATLPPPVPPPLGRWDGGVASLLADNAKWSDLLVVPPPRAPRLRSTVAWVHVDPGCDDAARVAETIGDADTTHVAIVFPYATATPEGLRAIEELADGDRVALVLGGAWRPRHRPPEVTFVVAEDRGPRLGAGRAAPLYAVVPRGDFSTLGAAPPGTPVLAAVLAFGERALGAGRVVRHEDIRGIAARHPRWQLWRGPAWHWERAVAALMLHGEVAGRRFRARDAVVSVMVGWRGRGRSPARVAAWVVYRAAGLLAGVARVRRRVG